MSNLQPQGLPPVPGLRIGSGQSPPQESLQRPASGGGLKHLLAKSTPWDLRLFAPGTLDAAPFDEFGHELFAFGRNCPAHSGRLPIPAPETTLRTTTAMTNPDTS
jgi:hypothetical protein